MNSLSKFIERNSNYIKYQEPDKNIVEKYRGVFPKEIIYIWETYGFGTFEDGFVHFINPKTKEYLEIIGQAGGIG